MQDLAIKLIFGSQGELDKFLAKGHSYIGDGAMRNCIVFAVIATMLSYGLVILSKTMNPSVTPHFEANNNTIINIGAGEANISPQGLQSIIEKSISDKKNLAKSAIRIVSAARSDENASLKIGDENSSVTIPSKN